MAKKRTSALIFSVFFGICLGILSNVKNDELSIVKADDINLVNIESIAWNNIDYSYQSDKHWVPDTNEEHIPQEGYCLLPLYKSNISISEHFETNLLDADLPGCNVGDHILINGVECKDVDDVIVYCYPTNGFLIYVPSSSFSLSEEYQYLTIEILEGMSIDGSAYTVASRFEYRGLLGSTGKWQLNPDPVEMKNAELSKIEWNNRDHSATMKQEWSGEINSSNSPINGYCLLAFFNEVGKSFKETVIGDLNITGRGVIGMGIIDNKIKVNGVNIIDVVDSICYIFPEYGLFFYIPDSSILYNDEYKFPVISLEEGIHFNNVILPSINFEFRGEIGEPDKWTYTKDSSEYNHIEFTDVAGGWNNVPLDSNHSHSVLQFGQYGIDYLKNDKLADENNLVSKYSYVGLSIFVNGVSLAEIGDVCVSYAHGFCYLYIALPNSVLKPSNGYKICNLHINKDTIFFDSMLGEVDLYLFNGEWIKTRPETPEDSDYDNAFSFSDVYGIDEIELDESLKQLGSSRKSSINQFSYYFDYKLPTEMSSFSVFVLGTDVNNGLELSFAKNKIMLYDATENENSLASAELPLFNYDEWYSILFYTKVIDSKLSLFVAFDDIVYIHLNDVNLKNASNIGNVITTNLLSGNVLIKNAVYGSDNKKPVITYTGKAVYGVLVGTDAIDFTNKCTSYDLVDGDVSELIQYIWQEGALTNGKINKGIWDVRIVSIDRSNNKSEMSVVVIGSEKLEVTVTFDGKNPTNYKVGDHIAPVKDPEIDDETGYYKFIGWYFNDRPWDFENDYLTQDLDFVSKFQYNIDNYIVSITEEGLENPTSYVLYFTLGSRINLDIFSKDGYTLEAYVNGEKVDFINVTGNISVKLVYTSTNPPEPKGCGGSIATSASIVSILSGAALILLVASKKKGEKEYE